MNVNDRVRIVSCNGCKKLVGKVYPIKSVDNQRIELNYGRGRPIAGRPRFHDMNNLELFVDLVEAI